MTAYTNKFSPRDRGFSVVEMLIVVAIILVLGALVPPMIINTINAMKLEYAAIDMSGLIQKTRIEAVRKNSFYSIQQTSFSGGDFGYYADLNKTGTFIQNQSGSVDDPVVRFPGQVTIFQGAGSGAPGETAFIASLNFAVNASTALPSFTARGLPCVIAGGGTTCTQTPGQGFVYFISRTSGFGTNWAAVAITPSGHVQVYTCSGTTWTRR